MKNGIGNLSIPVDNYMKLIQADNRGFIISFILKRKEYLLIYTKANNYRAGHSHDKTQFNVIIEGDIMWNNKIIKDFLIRTMPNEYHKMYSITDSLIIEWKE